MTPGVSAGDFLAGRDGQDEQIMIERFHHSHNFCCSSLLSWLGFITRRGLNFEQLCRRRSLPEWGEAPAPEIQLIATRILNHSVR